LAASKEKIRLARQHTILTINAELIKVYWEIGKTIDEQETSEGWGTKVVQQLAQDLKVEFPDMKGLSVRNLRYLRESAKAYPDFLILRHPAAKLPWTHYQVILYRVKDQSERLFYIVQTSENNWSRNVLAPH